MTVKITYFVHGTTTDNETGIATGWNPGKLSPLGIEQTKKLRVLLKNKKFDVVFCSDLERAVQSANLMFDKNVKIIHDKRLRECNYGTMNGTSAEKVEALTVKYIDIPFPGGECYMGVEKRVKEFLKDLKKNHLNKNIAIVSHRGPQLALDVLLRHKTWKQAINEDWRHSKAWQPGWDYEL